MAVEQREAGTIRDKIDFHFLEGGKVQKKVGQIENVLER